METANRFLRGILAVDTALGVAIGVPLSFAIAVGCLFSSNFLAAVAFATYPIIVGAIYGRYWRRFPLRKNA
jgi:hypothetical protein